MTTHLPATGPTEMPSRRMSGLTNSELDVLAAASACDRYGTDDPRCANHPDANKIASPMPDPRVCEQLRTAVERIIIGRQHGEPS